jgi:RNA-directed DNA polymerase
VQASGTPKIRSENEEPIRELTARSNGWGNEYRTLKLTQFIRGRVNYFALADMKRLLSDIDEWLRRKIRAIYWKQWKKVKTRYKMIKNITYRNGKYMIWLTAGRVSGVLPLCLTVY